MRPPRIQKISQKIDPTEKPEKSSKNFKKDSKKSKSGSVFRPKRLKKCDNLSPAEPTKKFLPPHHFFSPFFFGEKAQHQLPSPDNVVGPSQTHFKTGFSSLLWHRASSPSSVLCAPRSGVAVIHHSTESANFASRSATGVTICSAHQTFVGFMLAGSAAPKVIVHCNNTLPRQTATWSFALHN
jgi:hypothetical protein